MFPLGKPPFSLLFRFLFCFKLSLEKAQRIRSVFIKVTPLTFALTFQCSLFILELGSNFAQHRSQTEHFKSVSGFHVTQSNITLNESQNKYPSPVESEQALMRKNKPDIYCKLRSMNHSLRPTNYAELLNVDSSNRSIAINNNAIFFLVLFSVINIVIISTFYPPFSELSSNTGHMYTH